MSGNFTRIESDDDFENKSWSEPENPFEYQLVLGWIYFVIVVVGFIGNIAIVIVTCTKPWRGTPLSVILIALALSDILILLSTPLTFFVKHVYDIEVVSQSQSICKLVPFMIYAAQLTSAWLWVCVVLERVLNVVLTRDSITRWTQRPLVAVVVVIAIWVVCYAINTHFLTHWSLTGDIEYIYCSSSAVSVDYDKFYTKQLPWFELFLAFIVPYSVSVLGSIVILNNANVQHEPTRAEQTSTSLSLPMTTFRVALLILSITSIVTIGPQTIYILYLSYNYSSSSNVWLYPFIHSVLAALAHTNAAMKFYLYAISDKEFRDSLLAMVGRRSRATTYASLAQGNVPGNDMETFNNETRL